jgi:hypothetical protein
LYFLSHPKQEEKANGSLFYLQLIIQYLSSCCPQDGAKLAQLQLSLGAFLDFTPRQSFGLIYLTHA